MLKPFLLDLLRHPRTFHSRPVTQHRIVGLPVHILKHYSQLCLDTHFKTAIDRAGSSCLWLQCGWQTMQRHLSQEEILPFFYSFHYLSLNIGCTKGAVVKASLVFTTPSSTKHAPTWEAQKHSPRFPAQAVLWSTTCNTRFLVPMSLGFGAPEILVNTWEK